MIGPGAGQDDRMFMVHLRGEEGFIVAERKGDKGWLSDLLQQRNWFLSAGLVVVIYPLIWYYLRTYSSFALEGEESTWLGSFAMRAVHVLPVIAAGLLAMGVLEKRRQESADRERKKKRYEATLEINRLRQGQEAGVDKGAKKK
jgi:hypothetical protein